MPERPTPPAGRPAAPRPSARPAASKKLAGPRTSQPNFPHQQAAHPVDSAPPAGRRQRADSSGQQAASGKEKSSGKTGAGKLDQHGRGQSLAKPEETSGKVVSALNERLAERARRNRVRNWRKIGGWAAAATVLCLAVWVAFFSAVFALDRTQISIDAQGQYIDQSQVDAVVSQYVGVPLPRIDTVNLRSELGELGAVRSASVTRVWPNGLEIALVAREPVAAVPNDAGAFVLVDAEGIAVATVAEVPAATAQIEIPLRSGEVDERILTAVLGVLTKMPEELLEQVERIAATTLDDITLTLADGGVVFWGSAESSELKGEVLRVLRTSPDVADVAVYDVSAPEMPITKDAP